MVDYTRALQHLRARRGEDLETGAPVDETTLQTNMEWAECDRAANGAPLKRAGAATGLEAMKAAALTPMGAAPRGDELHIPLQRNPYGDPMQGAEYENGYAHAQSLGHAVLNQTTEGDVSRWAHNAPPWREGFAEGARRLGVGRVGDTLVALKAATLGNPMFAPYQDTKQAGPVGVALPNEDDRSATRALALKSADFGRVAKPLGLLAGGALAGAGGALAGAHALFLGGGDGYVNHETPSWWPEQTPSQSFEADRAAGLAAHAAAQAAAAAPAAIPATFIDPRTVDWTGTNFAPPGYQHVPPAAAPAPAPAPSIPLKTGHAMPVSRADLLDEDGRSATRALALKSAGLGHAVMPLAGALGGAIVGQGIGERVFPGTGADTGANLTALARQGLLDPAAALQAQTALAPIDAANRASAADTGELWGGAAGAVGGFAAGQMANRTLLPNRPRPDAQFGPMH